MAYQRIQIAIKDSIGTLTYNNPTRINALSTVMIAEITEALRSFAADESMAVNINKATAKHFCAGHDLAEMTGGSVKENKAILDRCTRMMHLLHQLLQAVIAKVQGIATATGCQLVAWSDLAVAEAGERFSTPGVRIGLFCTTPGAAVFRVIGRKAVLDMLLTGRYVSAREALQRGLINRVVALPDLEDEVRRLASEIARVSRYVLAPGKQGFYAQVDQTDEGAFNYATNTIALNLGAEDAQIGIRTFLDKQKIA